MYGENVSHWSSHKTHILAMKALEMMMTMMMMTVDDSDNTTANTTTTMVTSTTAVLYLQLSLSKIGTSLQNCTFCIVYLTTLSVA
jgi:hypothetical protein